MPIPDTTNALPEHPWISLETPQDVEGWMDLHDRELQKLLDGKAGYGQGACFTLTHGGEVYLHTNGDGDVLLDVTPDAAWIAPVIGAATGSAPPRGQIWCLPQHVLIELILGMNSLIASSRLVPRHEYRISKM